MWPYKNHREEDYYKTIEFVENYAVSLGAEYVCTKEGKNTTFSGDKVVMEELKMRNFKFRDVFFWIEHHFQGDCPYIVFSFGDSIDSIFDDADPFPYNLEEEVIKAEVRYSLGIEKYH